jgi:hypothetical protein
MPHQDTDNELKGTRNTLRKVGRLEDHNRKMLLGQEGGESWTSGRRLWHKATDSGAESLINNHSVFE